MKGVDSPPPCPTPQRRTIEQVEMMIARQEYESIGIWLGRVERYCLGIDAIRTGGRG